jgi:hypothetical protein
MTRTEIRNYIAVALGQLNEGDCTLGIMTLVECAAQMDIDAEVFDRVEFIRCPGWRPTARPSSSKAGKRCRLRAGHPGTCEYKL